MSAEFQKDMLTEFEKFLAIYNNLTNSTISLKNINYSKIIRILGNFIHKELVIDNWENSRIIFSDQIVISLSVFKNTNYENSVKNFLISLKNAFYSNIDEDVKTFLENSKLNKKERELCEDFYQKVKDLNEGMKNSIFNDTNTNILENSSISTYADKLKDFNDFVYSISINQDLMNIILNFDQNIKNIAKNKKHPKIFFNV